MVRSLRFLLRRIVEQRESRRQAWTRGLAMPGDCDENLAEDLATTVSTKLGIPADLIAESPDGRPVR